MKIEKIGPTIFRFKGLKICFMKEGDEKVLLKFSNMMGDQSRKLFSPYHWGTEKQLSEYLVAITRAKKKEDASFIVTDNQNNPIALLYLWGISKKFISNNKSMNIPTLGICVADKYQNKGIGKAGVKFLQKVGVSLKADAIELTTVKNNDKAINLYLSCGFKDIGILNIPLGIDPSTTDELELKKATWRKERHMVYIINKNYEVDIMQHLSQKQTTFNNRGEYG